MIKLKAIVLLIVMLSLTGYAQDTSCTSFTVWIDDDKGEFTNIRSNPNGTIILKINHKNYNSWGYMVNVIGAKNGWLKINRISGTEACVISDFEGWIHTSVVGISTTHDIYLLDKPNGKKVFKVTGETLEHFKVLNTTKREKLIEVAGETEHFKIIEVKCNWLHVKTSKGSGWVKSEKLCGNPVTNCS